MKNYSCSFLILLVLPLLLLASCKVEKRLHRPGYHVEWNVQKAKSTKAIAKADVEQKVAIETDRSYLKEEELVDFPMLASVEMEVLRSSVNYFGTAAFKNQNYVRPTNMPCDTVFLLNNESLIVRLIEITPNEVKYKRCDLPRSPIYAIYLEDVESIHFGNGDIDYYADPSATDEEIEIEERIEHKDQVAEQEPLDEPKSTERKLEVIGLIAFIVSLGGFLHVIIAPIAMIVAIFSLLRHSNSDKNFMGQGFAQAALIIGILAIAAFLMFGPLI